MDFVAETEGGFYVICIRLCKQLFFFGSEMEISQQVVVARWGHPGQWWQPDMHRNGPDVWALRSNMQHGICKQVFFRGILSLFYCITLLFIYYYFFAYCQR
jgi:hypothetical protein